MKKRNILLSVILLIVVIVFGTIVSNAQEIIFTGEACPFTIYADVNQSSEIQVESIDVLGVMDDAYAVVAYQEATMEDAEGAPISQIGYIPVEELVEKVPDLDISSLPAVENWTNLVNGDSDDRVYYVQKRLIELGFLVGVAGGPFGPKTEESVNAFLASVGLPQTGVVNVVTWFLLQYDSASEPITVVYPPVYTVEEKYASIIDAVSDASILEGFTDGNWNFRYDTLDRQGIIYKTLDIDPYVNNDKAIDRITIVLTLALYLNAGSDGQINITPTLLIYSSGAYRPYFQSVSLNCGGTVLDLPVMTSDSRIERTNVIEESYIALIAEVCDAILAMENGAVLEARLRGVNRSYDIDLSSAIVELQAFAQNVSGIFVE